MVFEEIIGKLEAEEATFKIHEHEPVLTMRDVLEKLPFPKDKLLKTLVFKVKGLGWIFAVLRGQDMVDYGAKSSYWCLEVGHNNSVGGGNRKGIGFASWWDLFGSLSDNISVVFDESLLDMDVVYCGAGRNDRTLEIKVSDLSRICNAKFVRITKHL